MERLDAERAREYQNDFIVYSRLLLRAANDVRTDHEGCKHIARIQNSLLRLAINLPYEPKERALRQYREFPAKTFRLFIELAKSRGNYVDPIFKQIAEQYETNMEEEEEMTR